MKCPKCGFNSFEYYNACKKCSSDLTGYKQTYSITPLVLPLEAKEKLTAEFRSAENESKQTNEITETHDDIFSFDLPEDSPSSPVQKNDNPFDFNDPSLDMNRSNSSKSEDDVFADLLESTSQNDDSPFSGAQTSATSASAKSAHSSLDSNGIDLESFSWDDTPVSGAATDGKDVDDDFDSLFGDTKENAKK
jgi:predicted  nucleic acid-binding Zn-ribbon protein